MPKEDSVELNLFLTEKWDQAIFFFSFSIKWWDQHEEYEMIFFLAFIFFSFNIFLLSFLVLATQKKKNLFLNILFPLSVFRNLLFIYLYFLTKQSCLGSGNHFLCKAQKILTLYSPAEESHHLICFLLGIASRVAGEYCQTFRWYIDISFSFRMFVLFIEVHHVLMSDKNKNQELYAEGDQCNLFFFFFGKDHCWGIGTLK